MGGSRFAVPLLRGSDVELPYRAGKQWRPKMPDSRVVTLLMWTAGIDQNTGQPATDQRLAFNDNVRQLRSLFTTMGVSGSAQGTLTRKWYLTTGGPGIVTASALCELGGALELTMNGRTGASFSVDLLLSDPYFYGSTLTPTALVKDAATAVSNPGDSPVGMGTGPFTVTLNGPLTNPVLTNQTYGVSLTYTGTITSGHFVTFSIPDFTAVDDFGANQIALVSHLGARYWMLLMPGSNTLKLTASSGSGTAALSYQPPYV